MAFSTECRLRRAWRFHDLDLAVVGRMFGEPPQRARDRLAAAARAHIDAACVERLLETLSVPALAVLAILVEADGALERDDLIEAAQARFAVEPVETALGVNDLVRELLAVPLQAGAQELLAIVDLAADTIADRVRQLDIPVIPPDAAIEPHPDDDVGREVVATCAALRHFDVKTTQGGAPHRAGTKRLAKQIGLGEQLVEASIDLGLVVGLLAPDADDILRPRPTALVEAARGRYPQRPVLDVLARRLAAAGAPVPMTAIREWQLALIRQSGVSVPLDRLARLPGFRGGKVGGVEVIAARRVEGECAATITPSFEVFLPPESTLEHVIDVLACADLVRIDRVIVARLSKPSVQRALAAGESAATLLAKLAAASRTPIPQNVAAAIDGWAADTVYATMAVGRVVVVAATEHERAARALEALRPAVLGRGVFVVDDTHPARGVSNLLAKSGIQSCSAPDEPAAATAAVRRDEEYPPLRGGDPILQRRVAAYRAHDPTERARARVQADDRARGDDELAMTVSSATAARIERWERSRGALRDEDATVLAALGDVVAAPDRDFLFAANDEHELRARVGEVLLQRGGLGAFLDAHRALVERILPPELVATMETAARTSVALPEQAWSRTDIVARLVAAERTRSTLVVDLGAGQIRSVRVLRVQSRGRVLMLLGEDIHDESSVAVPVASILGVAEPTEHTPSAVWKPVSGQAAPPGHAPCPCRSGRKYRACCRPSLSH